MPLFMRLFLAAILFWGSSLQMPGAGSARAAPPEGFAGDLFIDATGCVLDRIGRRWQERLLRDGTRDCGYPPTPLGRDQVSRPAGIDLPLPADMPLPEAKLLAIMAEGLTEDDLESPGAAPAEAVDGAADHTDMAALAEAGAGDGGPGKGHPVMQELAAALGSDAARARVIMAGGQPNARLCALLDVGKTGAAAGGITSHGLDPSRGFCPDLGADVLGAALRPAMVLPATPERLTLAEAGGAGRADGQAVPSDRPDQRLTETAPDPAGAADAQDGAGAAETLRPPARHMALRDEGAVKPASDRIAADQGGERVPAGAGSPGKGGGKATTRAPAAARDDVTRDAGPGVAIPAGDVAMIPANARYLQIGGPVSPDAAAERFRRIAALGLPVARGRIGNQAETVLVMAGPFPSRQAISRALDQLRRAGFRNIAPH